MRKALGIILIFLLLLVGTVSATTFYLDAGNSDLTGGSDFSKNLTTTTSTPSTLQISVAKGATETSYAWTQAGTPNNADWETGGFTVKVNVTALASTADMNLNVQVDRVNAAGSVQESSATSTNQQLSSTGVKTFSIASKDWTAGSATDRLRLRYILYNSKSNTARTVDISFGDINSYVDGSVSYAQTPVAAFSANVTTGCAPLSVAFTDASTNTPTTWDWRWYANETTGSTSQNPTFSFAQGTYSVRLYASNAVGGDYENKTSYISTTAAPVAAFTKDKTSGGYPLTVTFTDTSSPAATSWLWVFGDGDTTNSTVQHPIHTFATVGTYNANLTATNCGGSNTTATQAITVTDTTPPASITNLANSSVTSSQINWTWTKPTDADFNHTYVLKDNVFYANLSNTTSYSLWTGLTEATSYTISTKTVDITGNMNVTWVNQTATTLANPPVAAFSVNKNRGTTPLVVTFTDKSTNTPTSWFWVFGDGSTENNTQQNPVHTFTSNNNSIYSVNVTATNSGGSSTSSKTEIRVSKSGPLIYGASQVAAALNSQTYIRSLVTYDDGTGTAVYGGTYNGGRLFKYNGTTGGWVQVAAALNSQTYIASLVTYDDGTGTAVYGGTFNDGRLFKYNGTTGGWVQVAAALNSQSQIRSEEHTSELQSPY